MTIRVTGIWAMTFILAYFFAPLANLDGNPVARIPAATAVELGFEDAAVRAEAMKKVIGKTVPGGSCQSLINNQENFRFTCDENMLPLDRSTCEYLYREIIAENTCRDPYAPSPAMSQPEMCVALNRGFARMCGANKKPEHDGDCSRTQASIEKNKCVPKLQ